MRAIAISLMVSTLSSGCISMAANLEADVVHAAAPAFDAHWDYEFAGRAAPASIMRLEGVHRVVPENELVLLELSKAYTGYAYGWIEDEIERVDPMDFEREEHLRLRARLMYMRARNLAFALINLREDGFDAARTAGIEPLQRWLREECDDAEDAEMLFWAGYAWGSAINLSRDDPEMLANLAHARALIERVVELDEAYFNASAVTFMAVLKASMAPALGGDPDGARALFARALELTERRFLLVQVNFARTYAVQAADRELFESLLREVVEAGDINPTFRLHNKIARRRAYRYLAQADELFY